jgi:protein-disulfide isomerase
MSKKILISISQNSDVIVETEDYKGPMCVKDIKQLFNEFLEVDYFDYKAEYYESEEEIYSGVITKL